MKVKDIREWFGDDCEVYSCLVERDLEELYKDIDNDEIIKKFRENVMYYFMKYFSYYDILEDILSKTIEEYDKNSNGGEK